MVAEVQTGTVRDYPAYLHFTPRPDQPEKWDEQTGFYESKSDGVAFCIGGNGSGTTSCLIAKICRFVLETPPPRKDTPFWIIAESYQQICSLFDEKVDQQGHLPPHVIDRERIQWYKVNNNWPFRVPLKSPPGYPGKNWCLEFKSWRQGRGQMQARSLGGFGFIEQFPWGVFEEVLRGCREYNFPGSKLVEYTPVDPDMSVDLEEMLESGYEPENGREPGRRYLPRNWKIYHANTACAAEAGHVDRGWFEEFFGMVPEDMLDTRMKGLFSTFEGVIYKGFSPEIHCMGDEMWPRIRYCPHRRGIDWGAGPENDFACAWGARNGLGQWFVYDSHSSNDQLKTTVDHLSDVYEQWEWPEDNSLYGTTYADPSSPDNIRIAGKMRTYNPAIGNFSIQRGRNSVLEGIEHIQYLLKPQVPVPVVGLDGKPKLDADGNQVIKLEPKLFFHRQNCAKLIGQMKTYRWLRGADPSTKASRNPRDPARQPLKKNDHLCLAGDVRVLMANNTMIPISQISVGDWVLSHLGITQVVAIECTGVEHVVQFEGPTQVISCTPDHPWYNNFGEYDDMANALWLMRLNPWAQKVITDIPEEHGRHLKPRQNLKAFFVKEISPFDKQEPVYSLATEDGTYFADGLLCSNCDALRYMCFSDDFMSGSTISSATFRSGLNTQLDGHYLPQGDIRHIRTDHRGRN